MFILKQRGDTIDIIAMNPSGLWRGRCQGRIGHFKFINVELLPDRHVLRSSEQRQKSVTSQRMQNSQDGPPKTVEDLLKRIGLEVIFYDFFRAWGLTGGFHLRINKALFMW